MLVRFDHVVCLPNEPRAAGRQGPVTATAQQPQPKQPEINNKMNKTAKMPAFQMLTISNVPSDILEAIDELAARQDRSRSSFVRRQLQRIVAEYQAKALASRLARNRNAA